MFLFCRKHGVFTPEELPNNKYYIFGQEGANLEDLGSPFLGVKFL
jgi:hypothetical protein